MPTIDIDRSTEPPLTPSTNQFDAFSPTTLNPTTELQLWAYNPTGARMSDTPTLDGIEASISNAAQNNANDPTRKTNMDLSISAHKHADIIDVILAGPTNATAIEVKNITLATAAVLLRLLADTI